MAASMKLSVSLQLLDLGQSVGFLGPSISKSQGLYLYTNTEKRTHNTINNHALSGFEPKVPTSARAKTVDALDRSATVTGGPILGQPNSRNLVCVFMEHA
jgi:hypothetical protein